jgi:hypothetical protein
LIVPQTASEGEVSLEEYVSLSFSLARSLSLPLILQHFMSEFYDISLCSLFFASDFLYRAGNLGEISTVPLIDIIKNQYPQFLWIAFLIDIFIVLSITVSYITVGTATKHVSILFFVLLFRTNKTEKQKKNANTNKNVNVNVNM